MRILTGLMDKARLKKQNTEIRIQELLQVCHELIKEYSAGFYTWRFLNSASKPRPRRITVAGSGMGL